MSYFDVFSIEESAMRVVFFSFTPEFFFSNSVFKGGIYVVQHQEPSLRFVFLYVTRITVDLLSISAHAGPKIRFPIYKHLNFMALL